MNKLRLVIWFGGIGADCRAFDRANIGHHIVDCVELDKHAIKSFNLLNNTNFEPKDINDVNVNGYGEVDMLVAGGPCQDLSIAGKQVGLVEGKRSSLIGTTIKKIKEMKEKPKVILLENVKGLLFRKNKENFQKIRNEFEKLGYYFSYKLLNAKYFGVSQNRERVYCVLTRDKMFDGEGSEKFNTIKSRPNDILENKVIGKTAHRYAIVANNAYVNATKEQVDMRTSYKRYGNIDSEYLGTLAAATPTKIYQQRNNIVYYRTLTPKECGKLMGFTNEEFNKVKEHISNNQLCKQAGNSIVVNVLVEIFKELYKTRREKMDNIKKVFKNIKLDDELFYGDGKCAETPDENGDFVSKISERSIARTIMEYSLGILGDNKEIREGADKKLIELSPDYEYELEIEDVKVLKAVIGEGGDYSVDIEITFEVIG